MILQKKTSNFPVLLNKRCFSIVLRILVQDPTASTVFGRKFGADPEKIAPKLLEEAKRHSMNVHGIR